MFERWKKQTNLFHLTHPRSPCTIWESRLGLPGTSQEGSRMFRTRIKRRTMDHIGMEHMRRTFKKNNKVGATPSLQSVVDHGPETKPPKNPQAQSVIGQRSMSSSSTCGPWQYQEHQPSVEKCILKLLGGAGSLVSSLEKNPMILGCWKLERRVAGGGRRVVAIWATSTPSAG